MRYIILIIAICLNLISFSQKKFSGVVTYKITYGDNNIEESSLKLLPEELKVSISKKFVKRESISKLGKTTIITDLEQGKSQILIDLSTEKKYIKDYTPNKKSANRELRNYKITFIDSAKTINGEKCKFVKLESEQDTLYGFYSEKLSFEKVNIGTPYSEVNFILLEYIEKSNFPIKYEAVEIKRQKFNKEEFEVPEGFRRLLNL
jgi:hypothetical protein